MKKFIIILSLLFLSPLTALAETGFIYRGDLNGDGVDDSIQSGPRSLFGKSGGPCVITLSTAQKKALKALINCRPDGFILEKSENKYMPSRYWGYWNHGGGEATVTAITLDGKFKRQSLDLYGTVGNKQNLSNAILVAIKTHTQHIKFKPVENYTPPEHPCGDEWGKGGC
ncbi:MAG: hypothetical protein OEY52_02425 [Gammaproteobacteria bacterium]|nr:hypothetical protein [Gammaproteobacteria bacterium]